MEYVSKLGGKKCDSKNQNDLTWIFGKQNYSAIQPLIHKVSVHGLPWAEHYARMLGCERE